MAAKRTLCLFQSTTHTCITRAERTKRHLQVLYVGLNVKQIRTGKSQKKKRSQCWRRSRVEWARSSWLLSVVGKPSEGDAEKLEHKSKVKPGEGWALCASCLPEKKQRNLRSLDLAHLLRALSVCCLRQVYTFYTPTCSLLLSLPPLDPSPSTPLEENAREDPQRVDTCRTVRCSEPILT